MQIINLILSQKKPSDKLSLTDPESLDIEGDDISTEVVEEGKLTFYSFL